MSAPAPIAAAGPAALAAAAAAARQPSHTVRLPNGLAVRCVSRRDPPFLYREIWERRCYLQAGIELPRGGTVLDVGGNIGLASLFFADLLGPQGLVVACEPLPPLHACLQHNVAAHRAWREQQQQQQQQQQLGGGGMQRGSDGGAPSSSSADSDSSRSSNAPAATSSSGGGELPAHIVALNVGVGDGSAAEATFTFYPRAAGWSSMRPAEGEVAADMGAFLSNALASSDTAASAGLGPLAAAAGAALRRWAPAWAYDLAWRAAVRGMLAGAAPYRCRLASVSGIMRQQGLSRVDLLKVDVERAELEVLRGVEACDWPAIQAAALEVHAANLDEVLQVLRRDAGFSSVEVQQDAALAGSSLHSVYARRG